MNEASDVETEKRRDDALRRALNTPPKPKKKSAGTKPDAPLSEEDHQNGRDAK